jgi:hypothetical protein
MIGLGRCVSTEEKRRLCSTINFHPLYNQTDYIVFMGLSNYLSSTWSIAGSKSKIRYNVTNYSSGESHQSYVLLFVERGAYLFLILLALWTFILLEDVRQLAGLLFLHMTMQ